MKLLSVLLSILLCFALSVSAMQMPEGGEFPFDGRNFRVQNPENTAGQDGFWGIWTRYSNIIISLGVLIVSFVFVGFYRRRHY